MDDAVMRYSDLIAPDNSIDSLIDLLGKVQSEYSELAQLAKKYAANMATDMRKVNTTTKAGRDELARLTVQADMAANAVKSIEAMYAGVNDELNNINSRTSPVIHSTAALIEQIQKYQRVAMGLRNIRELYEPSITFGVIDDSFLQSIKDVDSIMASISERANRIQQALIEVARTQEVLNFDAAGRAASDSLTSLRLALKDIIASYEDLEAMERGGERGQATKNNLDTLRDAVTRLEAEIEPLVNKTLELIRAQQGLDLATSDEGKQIIALKQKIAELNKETALRITLEKELAGSRRAIEAELKLAQNELAKIPDGTPEAEALQAKVQDLATALAKMNAKTKPIKAELTALEQATQVLTRAQKALEVALTDEGKAAIGARQELAALNKETRLQAKEATAEEGAYDQLKAQLEQLKLTWKALQDSKRDNTAEGRALEAQIKSLGAQVKALDDRLKPATASMSQDQLETMQAADVTEKLAKAKAKLVVTQSAEYEELIKTNIAQREANRIAKLEAQLANSVEGSYNNMAAQYELNKIKLKQLALANRELTEDEKKLVAETYTLRNEMKKFQEMTGVHTLSVGEYGKVWDSFGYSIQQIVREMPAAAMGINNLFIAVSNNIPIFVDELMKLRKENAAFIAQNQPEKVISIGKRIASSLFSWQTALMALITVLTMYGDEITKWIGNLFRGEAAVISMKKAIRNLNKELENSNDSYGDNRASFKKLQNQWSELTTEVEKTEWIKNHEEAFKDLGLAIEDVNSAERILVQEADTVEETFRRRAEAAAATALATKEYEKALVASANAEQARAEKAEKAAKRYEKRTGKSTVTEYHPNEAGEYTPVTMNAYDYFYEAYGEDSTRDRKINRLKSEAKAAEETAEQYLKLGAAYDDLQDKDEDSGGSEGRDLTDRIYKARLEARKKYEKSQTALIKDEYDRREEELKDAAEAEIEAQKEVRRKAIEWRDDPENNYKDLTADEQKAIQEIISKSSGIIINTEKKLNEDLAQLAIDRQIAELKLEEETLKLRLDAVEEGSMAEISLRTRLLRVQGDIEVAENRKTIKIIKEDNAKAAREADEAFIQRIKDREDFSSTVYKDAGGHKTIGYGFTKYAIGRELADDETITAEEADRILRDIIKNTYEPQLNKLLDQYGLIFNQTQYNELLDLSYQGGIGAVNRLIQDAVDTDEGIAHIKQVYSDVGATIGADAAERFGESFIEEYTNADIYKRIGLLFQSENLYTGGTIGGANGAWYTGMQARSDSRSERFMAEPTPEVIEENKQSEANIVAKWNKIIAAYEAEWQIKNLEHRKEQLELKLQATREGSAEELKLQKELLDEQLKLELKQNELLADNLKKQEDDIKASYARREKLLQGKYMLNAFQEGQSATRARYIADDKAGNTGIKSKQLNDYYLGIFDLEQEIALLEKQIEMAGQGFLEWSPEQIAEAEANVEKLNKDSDETKDIWNLIGKKGIGGGILTQLGFDDDQIDALSNATNIVIDQINAIMAAEVEAAEKAVELAQERVDAFQSAYDAEIEARNNGYANNVATAKKELEQEKKNQREKQKLLEQAQKRQEAVNSVVQASSLITASAQLWSSFSGLGPIGPARALAAIAAMWGSFAVAKVKAKQVAETYGDGGLEFLEGGSHASGHDIDLGTTNSRGRRMRAEGGEAMAIINKKNTRKYKAMLPDIIDSLNSGNFEEKYLSSLNTSGLAISVNSATVDISRIEGDVADMKKQNETKYYVTDSYLVIQHKNVKRIIKN